MSLLYAVVFASRCRSNHHRLALDALRRLRSRDGEAWRDLLLHYHDEYLKGAKAPDEVFKDFKNHVLHVRDGDWGGAIEACEEWYRRTVAALKKKEWDQAAWSAGVLHYVVDLDGRTCSYFGLDNASYVERYPAVSVSPLPDGRP